MAECVEGVLKNRSVEGPFNGEHGSYFKVGFKVGDISGTKLANDPDMLPKEGENVKVDYIPSGRFNKILSVKLNGDGTFTTESKQDVKSKVVAHKKTETKPFISQATNKDISMEVSGLLQALINTGTYNEKNEKGIFLKLELLETHLRLALTLKRKVAKELEEGTI